MSRHLVRVVDAKREQQLCHCKESALLARVGVRANTCMGEPGNLRGGLANLGHLGDDLELAFSK